MAEFERHEQEQEEPKDSSVATQLDELRQQYNILEWRCTELEHMLEEEHMARQAAETVASEVKQELLMYEERCDRRVSQIREEIGDYSMTNACAHTGVSHKSPAYTVGRGLDTYPSLSVSQEGHPAIQVVLLQNALVLYHTKPRYLCRQMNLPMTNHR